jgi:two-component system response regulator RegX3
MAEIKQKILVVDDELSIAEFVSYNLRKEGFEVDTVADGPSAVKQISGGDYDLIILDVMLPGIDGYEVLRQVRPVTDVPVLFLSARDTELDKVVGLELGGDDYLAKPFGVHELLARVKSLLRRSNGTAKSGVQSKEVFEAGGIHVDTAQHVATFKGTDIDLTPREFELLSTMMRYAGKVVGRDQLLREAWGWETLVETKTVDTHIKRLRDKLEAAGVDPAVVETVRGYGYKFKA